MRSSENGGGGKDNVETFAAAREVEAQRRRERTVEADPDPVIVLEIVEVQVAGARGDLAGVVEHRGVDVAIDHDAPLGLQLEAVAIAEAPARIRAQRRAATDRRQHEERNLLAALEPGGG